MGFPFSDLLYLLISVGGVVKTKSFSGISSVPSSILVYLSIGAGGVAKNQSGGFLRCGWCSNKIGQWISSVGCCSDKIGQWDFLPQIYFIYQQVWVV